MAKKSSIKKNLAYQTAYQILTTILPLITAPYLARTLGATQQGIYSYTNSIVCFFTLFAMLGITSHGVRRIAKSKDDIEERSKAFFSIFSIQIISCSLVIVSYLIYLLLICKENYLISGIQSIAIISCFIDINWLFLGMEDFKFVVIRNMIIKTISVILIIMFVKSDSDLWIYTLIMVSTTFISNMVLTTKFKKYIIFKFPTKNEIIKEIKPIFILFIPLLAMSFYHIMDKTMLGILSDYENVGYYYNADKVINIPIGIITGISTVLFPRGVALLNNESKEKFEELFKNGLEGTIATAVALSFGIASISQEFTPLFFGNGFETCINLIIVLSPVMVVKAISTIIRYQYLVPKQKEKIFIISVFMGAFVNFIANVVLIKRIGAMGAVLGTLIAETVACLIQVAFIRKEIAIVHVFIKTIPYVIIGIIMYGVVRLVSVLCIVAVPIKIVLQVFSGGIVFSGIILIYWKKTNNIFLKNIMSGILKKNITKD